MSRPAVVVAELSGGADRGQDRCRTADGLVIVLDGASAFDKQVNPDASEYVDYLADTLMTTYVDNSGINLKDGLFQAIEKTASALGITPGRGPSSTVAVVRWGLSTVDTLILGDSTIIVRDTTGREVLTDDSLAKVAPDVRRRYKGHLASGEGFTAEHRDDLAELQRCQAARRNKNDGYWIAEADPQAAQHALLQSFPVKEVKWCVAVTDGAQRPIDHLGYRWDVIANLDANSAFDLLVDLHHWESHNDPEAAELPRAKRHDDKTIVISRRV